jgi:hypothetical protein
MNRKLQEIGSKLNVSEEDISRIQKERTKEKLLYTIIGAIIVGCSTVAGFLTGKANPVYVIEGGYPFATSGLSLVVTGASKKEKNLFSNGYCYNFIIYCGICYSI